MKIKQIVFYILAVFMIANSLFFMRPAIVVNASEREAVRLDDALPEQYCMRDEYILYAQNQDKLGYCWNFAATMAASTTLMKATGEYYDFSETWTAVSQYVRGESFKMMGSGGTISYQYNAMKNSGLMLESDLPYQYSYTAVNENAVDYYNFYEKYSNDDLASCLVTDSETKFTQDEVDKIKQHIYNHGSIYLTFTFRTGFVEQDGAFALEPNQTNTTSNHAIAVIGWDDNFQREYYHNGSATPTVYKGAWIVLNSYTEDNGNDGISFVFYEDDNIGMIQGYRYEQDTGKDLYFYDTIESGYAYPTFVKGKYYGDYTAETAQTKQKNIFYSDVDLEYSFVASEGAEVEEINIFLDGQNVTDDFTVSIDNTNKKFCISRENAPYGQYKLIVTYGNGERSDDYLNNFFVTHGLFGEEIEYDYDSTDFTFNPGRDLEFHSFITSDKNYVIYTNSLSGEISFLPTEQSIYSEKNMSLPNISYEITNGESCTSTYTFKSDSGYELDYNFIFEYCEDTTLQTVNVYYDLGGGVNHSKNYDMELAGPESDLVLYAPTRPGYTFAGWYLDYGSGTRAIPESDGVYCVGWDDIRHLGEEPGFHVTSYYQSYYNNSNTLFVYARWEEEEYYNIDLSITGEGTSQIGESISIGSDESVRFLLQPSKNWCISSLTVNGRALVGEELVEVMKYGLLIENPTEDVSIDVTFSEGVYLSLTYGENVKTAYVIGNKDGVATKFYDGDVISADYFDSLKDKFDPVLPDKDIIPFEYSKAEFKPIVGPLIPVFPAFGTQFTLVVEVYDDVDGYTFVPYDAVSYTVLDKGIFNKKIVIDNDDIYKEIDVGSATKTLIESVEVSYTVNSYVEDHYISTDISATSGEKNTATYMAGQVVYLFIKKPEDSAIYSYNLPDGFTMVGNRWYRKAICVNSAESDLGIIKIGREKQTYTVTWKNWDGSVLYTEDYRYGDTPVFNNKSTTPSDYPTRMSDGVYSYTFASWDRPIESVRGHITYIARYDSALLQYTVTVESTENGSVTPNGSNTITPIDRHTYIFTPAQGYTVKDVILNGVSLGPLANYTFTEVGTDQTLRVEFEKVKHSVRVICGEHGTVDLTGNIFVEHGGSLTLNIIPDEHYAIDFVKVNGAAVELSNPLTLSNITKDTLVEIGFKQTSFSITTESSSGGKITKSFTASLGESARIEFSARLFYRVKDVVIDGVSIGYSDCYTFVSIDRDHTVSVKYGIDVTTIVVISLISILLLGATVTLAVIIIRNKRRILPTPPTTHAEADIDSEARNHDA